MNFPPQQVRGRTERGFADPVLDAQASFRGALSALAEPGIVLGVATPAGCCPGFSPAMTALALTLLDFETRAWLDAGSQGMAASYLRFHTGVRLVERLEEAMFAFITRPSEMPPLSSFAQGTLEYPDTSCTIVVDISVIETAHGWWLSGPGIPGTRRLNLQPLPETLATDIAASQAAFPLGVDLFFCRDATIAALPRSTRVTTAEGVQPCT